MALPLPTTIERVEAPVTIKAYFITAFATIGGVFFGYDTGHINGVLGMKYFVHEFTGLPYPPSGASIEEKARFAVPSSTKSLIVSILSVGLFCGALLAGDLADHIGRRNAIISGCAVFCLGVSLQTASTSYGLLIAGRLVGGLGVGVVAASIILYLSEIAPRKIRGAVVSGYQFCITVGVLVSSCVTYRTERYQNSGSYRVPIGLQLLWAIILATGLLFLPESPRYFVRRGDLGKAAVSLSRVRGQPPDSEYVRSELAEIVANFECERKVVPFDNYFSSWSNCFKGSIKEPSSNLRRTILGASLQMMQQLTGIIFIFTYSTTFFQQLGTIDNPFLITLITTLVYVGSTIPSLWTIERFGRRLVLIMGAIGMTISEFIIAVVGTIDGNNPRVVKAQISFLCTFIFCYGVSWGPATWVISGEIFPLPIRSRGVTIAMASGFLWNCVVGVVSPYLVGPEYGNLGSKVFFLWGALCLGSLVYAYFLVPETKGLTLEQVDLMLAETSARTSAGWVPRTTFTASMNNVLHSAELVHAQTESEKHGDSIQVDPLSTTMNPTLFVHEDDT